MAKKYFTLIVKSANKADTNAKWSIQFGSYDRQDCEDERESTDFDGYYTKIITTLDDQASIDAKVSQLNQ